MRKLFKVIGIILGIFVALLLIATIAIKIFFPAEKIKALLLKELTAKLQREVTLEHVSFGLIKGLEVDNLRISESRTFARGTFVSVDNLDIRVRLLPLLSKRVEVDTLILRNPKISVTRAADGKAFNFSDLLASTATVPTKVALANCDGLVPCAYAAPGEPAAVAPPVNLQISQLEIQNGQVHFVDQSPAHQNADIDELNLKVSGFSMTDFFSATLHAKIQSMGMTVLAQASAKLNLKTSVVQLTNATFTIGESKIEASGQVSNYTSPAPTVALKVLIDALTPGSFGTLAALPPALQWKGSGSGNLDLNGSLTSLDIGGNLHLDGVDLRYGKLFVKPAKVPLSFSFNGKVANQSSADIREFGLKLGTLTASGNARVDGLAQKLPSLSLHMVTNDFSTADLLNLLPGSLPPNTKINGPAKLSADVAGTPASYKATAKLSGQDLVITSSDTFKKPAGMPFDVTFKGESVQNGARLSIESLLLNLGRIQMTLAGQYSAQGDDAKLALTLHSNDFPMDEMPKISPALTGYQFTGPGHLDLKIGNLMSSPALDGTFTLRQVNVKSAELQVEQADGHVHFVTPNALAAAARLTLKTDGRITVQHVKQAYYEGNVLSLVWALTDLTEDLAHINGTTQYQQGPGALDNVKKLAAQVKAARVVLMPIQTVQDIQGKGLLQGIKLPALDHIVYSSIHGDYAFHAGSMEIRAFDLVGRDLSVGSTGTVGLSGAQALDLRSQLKLAPGSIGGTVGQLIQDEQGRPTVKFTETGTVADPKIKLDLQEAGKKAVNQLLDGITGGTGQKSLNDLGNNLKNIFK